MTKKTKKRNPADLTKRNNDARKREIEDIWECLALLDSRMKKIENHQIKLLEQTIRILARKGNK